MLLPILRSICVEALNRGIYKVVRGSWVSIFRPEQTDQTRLITKREVAILFGVSKQTIDGWVKDGKLPQPRKSAFSARWHYEELVPLVKFKSNKARSVGECSDQSDVTPETRRALNADFAFKNRAESEERETDSRRPDLQGNRA
jgi:predicted DNA-binding transcriptional regulator AlpA